MTLKVSPKSVLYRKASNTQTKSFKNIDFWPKPSILKENLALNIRCSMSSWASKNLMIPCAWHKMINWGGGQSFTAPKLRHDFF